MHSIYFLELLNNLIVCVGQVCIINLVLKWAARVLHSMCIYYRGVFPDCDTSPVVSRSVCVLCYCLLLFVAVIVLGLYKEQIAEEEKLINQLDSKIKELEFSVSKQRKNMGGLV